MRITGPVLSIAGRGRIKKDGGSFNGEAPMDEKWCNTKVGTFIST